ncbi:UDP-glucuronosyl/UDP-glucosyltransferase [Sesbania bispinosa]|nr:UDP-glucuronosyl/UDP-glucosyltransferase [Sesbania bispinosa]
MSIPIVLVIPYPAQGHVNPFMNFSKKLVENGCKVLFVNTDYIHKRVVSSMEESEQQEDYNIKLVSIPDGLGPEDDRNDFAKLNDTILNTMPAMLEKLIEDLNDNNRINCMVADVCMGWALDVGSKLGINGALLCTLPIASFALLYNVPKLIDDGVIDSDGLPATKKAFQISPSMPTMDTRALFWLTVNGSISFKKTIFNYLMHCMRALNLADWWLCNTTYELERGALSFIPKFLPIGPILKSNLDNNTNAINARSMGQFWEEDLSSISWLNQQPHHSVLYVAFGSFTLFTQNQFIELALGLELTNRPFLWVVRQDPNCTNKMEFPNEFLGRKGKIIGWAPQQKILSHPAIACFVTHCGWNSTMEGLSNGTPPSDGFVALNTVGSCFGYLCHVRAAMGGVRRHPGHDGS